MQTFSTIGYGSIYPVGLAHNIAVTIQAVMGMLATALVTGMVFARFARPSAKIVYSKNILINNFAGKRSLVFRMANARFNQIAEARVNMVLLADEVLPDGSLFRRQIDLPLVRSSSLVFALSWTLQHEINPQSPLWNKTSKQLEEINAIILISVTGCDETFSQTVYARNAYSWEDVICDRTFEDITVRREDGIFVNIQNISNLKP